MEKLPTWITRDRPSNAARRGAGVCSKSAKRSSSMITRSECSAALSSRCAVTGDRVAPVGLWMPELVMYSRGECACSAALKASTSGPVGVYGMPTTLTRCAFSSARKLK
ncbi:hypothetical protein D3C71_1151890 [compost metagenome]